MFFLPQQISTFLADTSRDEREQELDSALVDLTPRLKSKRNEYRHFGPYWWWVKPLARSLPAARRSWLRGGYVDRSFLDSVTPTMPEEVPYGNVDAADQEQNRWIAWLGIRYYYAEILDETPAAIHIVDGADGEAFAYRLYDADASEQMDLFAEESPDRRDLEAFLADPVRFSGSAWLQRADEYIAEGDLLRGSAALRRAIDRAVDERDRTTAWIRLGQLFQEHRHTAKALFCYHNAWERDREGWIQGLIAEAYLENDEPHKAQPCYEAALAAMPGNPEYQAGFERCRRLNREREALFTFTQEPLAR